METKTYPKKSMKVVNFSTCVTCAKCGGSTGIYENLYRYQDKEVFYHLDCVSDDDTQRATETKVVELSLTDDLNVKSEGR